MEKGQRKSTSSYKQKTSIPTMRPLNLPRLAKNTSRLVNIDRDLQEVRDRLAPLIQPHPTSKKEYSPAPYRPKRRKRKSCNTQFVGYEAKQRERFHSSQLHEEQHTLDVPVQSVEDSHFTNIDIAIKEIRLRTDNQSAKKKLPTESTGVDKTLSSFEKLISKNRDLIRIARHKKKMHDYSSRGSQMRNSMQHKCTEEEEESPPHHKSLKKRHGEKQIKKNESALFENISSILQLRQKTENLREGGPIDKGSQSHSKRYYNRQSTAKNIATQPQIVYEQSYSRQEQRTDQQEQTARWRRVSLNERNQIEMVQSSFHAEIDKIAQYESKTKDYMGRYVKNLQTLMVLQLNDELRRRSLKVTERRPTQ